MIVFTTKLSRKKIIVGILSVCIIFCSAFVCIRSLKNEATVSVSEEQKIVFEGMKLKSDEDRIALLNKCGWNVEAEPIEFMEVRIPDVFDDVYNEYNEIQKSQGLDLSEFSGKKVKRYTYRVNNHKSREEGVVANIIVYKNKLIAGEICSPKLGGFMHGLISEENVLTENSENKPIA